MLHAVRLEKRADRKLVLIAVPASGWGLALASDGLRRDRDVVMRAIQQEPSRFLMRFFAEHAEPRS
jgi:hypothetical protein